MKIAINKYLPNDPDYYTYTFLKKVHGKWYKIGVSDNIEDVLRPSTMHLLVPSNQQLRLNANSIIYYGDRTLLKATLPELFI